MYICIWVVSTLSLLSHYQKGTDIPSQCMTLPSYVSYFRVFAFLSSLLLPSYVRTFASSPSCLHYFAFVRSYFASSPSCTHYFAFVRSYFRVFAFSSSLLCLRTFVLSCLRRLVFTNLPSYVNTFASSALSSFCFLSSLNATMNLT